MSERTRVTVEEYLKLEEGSGLKSEFCDGELLSMSGGSIEHNRLVRNLLTLLNLALTGKECEVFPSDLRLYVEEHRLFTYPDLMVVCGGPKMLGGRRDTVTDATLIIEVLSPSTQAYDHNEKFRFYRSLPSFAEYLLVAQDSLHVEQHKRQGRGQWLMTEHSSREGILTLSSIGVTLDLSAIYRGLDF